MRADQPQPGDRLAYFGRVSQPKQLLKHQREEVERWVDANGLVLPETMHFEDKIRRHEAASFFDDWEERKRNTSRKRFKFDAMMEHVEAGKIDWIVVAKMDRWGIRSADEIFVFRTRLRRYGVGLYSVGDSLNITGTDDPSFWRVAGQAAGATSAMATMAVRNISKMVSMTEAGWAATGNAPFGLDLVMYSLADLSHPIWRVVRTRYIRPHEFQIIHYTPDSRVERDANGVIVKSKVKVEKTENAQKMPPRDGKTTGYRYEPSVDARSAEAVRVMFEAFDSGMSLGEIAESMRRQGYQHYGKHFGYHGVEVILGNPMYTGFVYWGKHSTGEYRVVEGKKAVVPNRKKGEPLTTKKAEENWVRSRTLCFPPLVEKKLFDRVKARLAGRIHTNESFGKRRTRDKTPHPLNGKLFCPDCDRPMVRGSIMPGTNTIARTGKSAKKHNFVCGTYRRTIRTECHPNTVSWDKLDGATAELLKIVGERIDAVQTADAKTLESSAWMKQSELGRLILAVYSAAFGQGKWKGVEGGPIHDEIAKAFGTIHKDAKGDEFGLGKAFKQLGFPGVVQIAFRVYDRGFAKFAEPMRKELEDINEQLDDIAAEIATQRRKNPGLAERLDKKAATLEDRRKVIEPQLTPLTEKAQALLAQLNAVRDTIRSADKLKLANLLEGFIDKVYPVLEVRQGKRRTTEVTGFRFQPKATAGKVLKSEMKISSSHTGTGSSTHTG